MSSKVKALNLSTFFPKSDKYAMLQAVKNTIPDKHTKFLVKGDSIFGIGSSFLNEPFSEYENYEELPILQISDSTLFLFDFNDDGKSELICFSSWDETLFPGSLMIWQKNMFNQYTLVHTLYFHEIISLKKDYISKKTTVLSRFNGCCEMNRLNFNYTVLSDSAGFLTKKNYSFSVPEFEEQYTSVFSENFESKSVVEFKQTLAKLSSTPSDTSFFAQIPLNNTYRCFDSLKCRDTMWYNIIIPSGSMGYKEVRSDSSQMKVGIAYNRKIGLLENILVWVRK